MPKVDSNGRVVLPQRVRDRLRIAPGSEVEIREKNGKAVVEPADDPEDIVADLGPFEIGECFVATETF